jgi:hypothetical protein
MERACTQVWLLEIREYWARLETDPRDDGGTSAVRDAAPDPDMQTAEPPLRPAASPERAGGSCVLATCPDEGDRRAVGDL